MSASISGGVSAGVSVGGVSIGASISAAAATSAVANLLAPVGAATAAVGDILAAASSEVFGLVNTANAELSNFITAVNDPIAASFSTGQPYAGAFITSPTTSLITAVNFGAELASSTLAVAALSIAQIAALAAQTGIAIVTDADLALAMAAIFTQVQFNFKLSFSIDLTDDAAITPIPAAATQDFTELTYSIPSVTADPDVTSLAAFVAQVATSFPNTPGIAGVAASVWVDGLGVSVSATGVAVAGVPSSINSGVYGDITGMASSITPAAVPVVVVDYSYQQNQLNLVIALTIDNGLTETFITLLTSTLVTNVTWQVVKNRLPSVAQRGDAAMLSAMLTALGADNIPNAISLLTTLLTNLYPSDQAATTNTSASTGSTGTTTTGTSKSPPTFTASGITITTTSNSLTTAQLVTNIQGMITLVGTTIGAICSQNTCSSVFCSQTLLNAPLITQMDTLVIEALLDQTTVQLANMFV